MCLRRGHACRALLRRGRQPRAQDFEAVLHVLIELAGGLHPLDRRGGFGGIKCIFGAHLAHDRLIDQLQDL